MPAFHGKKLKAHINPLVLSDKRRKGGTTLRGALPFYNGQTQVEVYLR
jgi:hypothetical protein